MRSTLNIDDKLIEEVRRATGVQEKTRLLHLGLEALLREQAAIRLAKLFGSSKRARVAARRRSA